MPKKISPELRARAVRERQQDYASQTAAALAVAKQLGLGGETVRRHSIGSRCAIPSAARAREPPWRCRTGPSPCS